MIVELSNNSLAMSVECVLCSIVRYGLVSLAVGLLLVYLYFKWAFTYWKRRGVEFPKPCFPFGNISKLFDGKGHIALVLKDVYDQGKAPFVGFYKIWIPSLLVKDPQLIKQILVKDFNNFSDRGIHTDPDDPLSGHLFRLTGNKWKNLRMKLRPTFTSGKLKMMFPFLIHQGYHYQDFLKKCIDKGEYIDARDSCIRYTLDVIDSVAFGLDTNSFEDPQNDMRTFSSRFFDRNCSYFQGIINYLAISLPELMKCLNLKIFNQELTDFFLSLTKRIIDYREENKETRNDFMQLLIQLKNKGKVSEEDDAADKSVYEEKGVQQLSLGELAAQVFVFFIAGYETSANTMASTLYELALNPDIQEKAQKEIHDVLEKYDGKFSYECVEKMEYLGMIVSETLRKYPILGFLSRVTQEDYEIPDSGVTLEKGTQVFVSLLGLHYDPQYFPDPDKYDPERFSSENKDNIVPYSYMPFGEGPRHCIGMQMGKMQSRVGLAMILSKYTFSVCPATPKKLKPKYGQVLTIAEEPIILSVKEYLQ